MDTVIQTRTVVSERPVVIRRPKPLGWWPQSGMGRFLLIGVVSAAALAGFYAEENWRGRNDWEACKTAIEAKGSLLDWAAFIPPSVPEEQNIFAAPKMTSWFVGRGANELSRKLEIGNFFRYWEARHTNWVADVTVIGPGEAVPAGIADVVLDYYSPVADLASVDASGNVPAMGASPADQPLGSPLALKEVPVQAAIRTLAELGHLKFQIDRGAVPQPVRKQARITKQWKGTTTPRKALYDLLDSEKLKWVPEASNGIAHIARKTSTDRTIQLSPAADQKLRELLDARSAEAKKPAAGGEVTTALSRQIVVNPALPTRPFRIMVRTAEPVSGTEAQQFVPPNGLPQPLTAEEAGGQTFRVRMTGPLRDTASDYLAWSDTLQPEFESIGEALTRPYARAGGDYERAFSVPIPNFVCVRQLSQTLSQRAQCHLLLGQPAEALKEVTLLHRVSRLLENRTAEWSDKPTTLVAAMINVAITGLYVNTVADGLRLQVWRDADLAEIQRQLQEVHLIRQVNGSFETERAGICSLFEHAQTKDFITMFGGTPGSTLDHLKSPLYLVLRLGPRGWVYENMTTVARLEDHLLETFDTAHERVFPARLDGFNAEILRVCEARSPFSVLAAIAIPNFSRATQTTARNQTLANELLIVCGLERYHLVHHQYPDSLDQLGTEWLPLKPADVVGGQPLQYHPTADGKFVLYSVGWNEKDEGGKVVLDKRGVFETAEGDWVWPYREAIFR